MVSLLKSKKGGIPAISEIVQIVMGILPTPIKILLFLLLITTIASFIIPLFLGLFGYACVMEGSQVELYQVPISQFFQKTAYDIEKTLTDVFTTADYQLPEDAHPSGNKKYYKIPEQCYVNKEINGTLVSGYQAGCVDCEYYKEGFVETYLYANKFESFCIGDGEDIWNPVNVRNCDICEPKYPYYYNHTECLTYGQDSCYFTIINASFVSQIGTDFASTIYLQNIQSLNGVKRVQDSSEIVNIQCISENAPSIFVFSFELFNRLMWVMLILSGALVGFALKWYAMF